MFVTIYFGTGIVDSILNILPEWIMNGLSVAGGMMPAIGFAILINVIAKKSILPFFFLGFFIVQIFGCSTLQLACLGVPLAIAIVLINKETEDAAMKRTLQVCNTADDDDDE